MDMIPERFKEATINGELYDPNDPELLAWQRKRLQIVDGFNQIPPTPDGLKEKEGLLKEAFAEFGEGSYIEAPFHANFGGYHVHFGKGVYANFNLTLVDDGEIYVGDKTMFGPNVTLCTATHPLSLKLRAKGLQYNEPIHIGRNVWLGANVTVLPGISIGDNTVVGANSLVTKDLPENVLAYGSPCRVIRELKDDEI